MYMLSTSFFKKLVPILCMHIAQFGSDKISSHDFFFFKKKKRKKKVAVNFRNFHTCCFRTLVSWLQASRGSKSQMGMRHFDKHRRLLDEQKRLPTFSGKSKLPTWPCKIGQIRRSSLDTFLMLPQRLQIKKHYFFSSHVRQRPMVS